MSTYLDLTFSPWFSSLSPSFSLLNLGELIENSSRFWDIGAVRLSEQREQSKKSLVGAARKVLKLRVI